ncbi:hypothetical protein D3C77_488040 [compost metagenome]
MIRLAERQANTSAVPSPTRAAKRAWRGSPAPIAWPTRTVTAIPSEYGIMNSSELMFRAIWCPATTVAPRLPINSAITAKMLDSANTAIPMGRPTPIKRLITAHCGRSKRTSTRLFW